MFPLSRSRQVNIAGVVDTGDKHKVENRDPMGYSGARGKLIHEKNLNLKISCQTPFREKRKTDLQSISQG
jgi:hypothetical protein